MVIGSSPAGGLDSVESKWCPDMTEILSKGQKSTHFLAWQKKFVLFVKLEVTSIIHV